MKKIYITLLILLPLVSMAQINIGPLSAYKNPETSFILDTSIFNTGDFYSDEFYYSPNGDFEHFNRTQYKSKGNKIVNMTKNYFGEPELDKYIYDISFESEKPKLQLFSYKVVNDPNIYTAELDSFIYENGKIKYHYKIDNKRELYFQLEFIHDSINGLKKTQLIQKKPLKDIYGQLFEVTEFHKPNMPKIMYLYNDLKTDFELELVSYVTYDTLDRIISTIDSTIENGILVPYQSNKIVYLGNTTKIDSMYYKDILFNVSFDTKFTYNQDGKLKSMTDYTKENGKDYRMYYRTEFTRGTTGLSKTIDDQFKMNMYPNPTSDKIFIDSKENISEIKIYDTKGKLLLSKEENAIEEIDLSKLPSDVYIIKAKSKKGYAHSRIIKTN
jgi:hypothetical protein